MSDNVPPAAPAATSAPAPAVPGATATATARLTPAQLKAQKKAEKAARRGQIVAAKNVPETAEPVPSPSNDSSKGPGKQNRPKQDNTATPTNPKVPKKTGPGQTTAPPAQPPKKPKGPEVPEAFSYLAMAKKTPLSKADSDVHPAVLAVGQQMANFTLKDNLARLEAMLVAFQLVSHSCSNPNQHVVLM